MQETANRLCDNFALGRSPLNISFSQMKLLAHHFVLLIFAVKVLQPCNGTDPFEDAASLPVRQSSGVPPCFLVSACCTGGERKI